MVHEWAWFIGWFMLNIEGENDFEVEYSIEELVQLVQDGEHVLGSMENTIFIKWRDFQ